MPRREAAATSMVLNLAPARTTNLICSAANIGSVTFVPRTTNTSGICWRIASVRASSLRSGKNETSQPRACKPSRPDCSNLSAISTRIIKSMLQRCSLNLMNQQSVAQLRLKPGRLRRHDLAGIRNAQQVFHGCRVEREGYGCFSLIDEPLQFLAATHATNEIYSLVCADVFDTQDRIKHQVLENTHIQRSYGPLGRRDIGTQTERVPLAV